MDYRKIYKRAAGSKREVIPPGKYISLTQKERRMFKVIGYQTPDFDTGDNGGIIVERRLPLTNYEKLARKYKGKNGF